MMKIAKLALFCCAAFCSTALVWPLAAQTTTFDTSGNGMLNGTYYFRHVIYAISDSEDAQGVIGDISEAIAVYGNITFDGNGNYTIGGGAANGLVSDSGVGAPEPLSCYLGLTSCASPAPVAGLYSISASGFGYLVDPITTDNVYGLVSANGVFAGSSTETTKAYNDLFIAAPLASSTPNLGTFQGAYTVTGFIPGGSPLNSADMFFQMTADGNGNLGTVNVNGTDGAGNAISQSNSNMKYFFSNGAAVVTFPDSSTANFFSDAEYLYFSPDGSFFFGGSPSPDSGNSTEYDMIIGVRNGSGTQNFGGLYYEAGIDQNFSQLTTSGGYVDFDGYYGSLNATSTGTILAADRLDDIFTGVYGNSYSDSFTPPVTGSYTDSNSNFQFAVGDGGAVRVGQGIWPFLGITVALQAPTFTPTGSVYINPTGIVNAASFSPFTAGISDGEFLTVFGTNLAPSSCTPCVVSTADFDVNNAYPTTFQGVQVLINGVVNAPIYFVSPGQIAFIVPAATPLPLASIQVINNSGTSNMVDALVNQTTPGIYTDPADGVGYARVVDVTSGQLLDASTPAQPGDTIEVFATGLGTAYPPVADGAAPPTSPLSKTTNTITAAVGGVVATVGFAGLAPTLAGLYQVNVTIPSTLTSGVYTLDLSGPDSYNSQALIAIGTAAADRKPAASARKRLRAEPAVKRPCMFRGKSICGVDTLPERVRGLE
jgi:uncharacterized protein (TIGR03437 family)